MLDVSNPRGGAARRAASRVGAGLWPSKPVRLIVPYPPGGSTDLLGAHRRRRRSTEELGAAGAWSTTAPAPTAWWAPTSSREVRAGRLHDTSSARAPAHGLGLFLSKAVPYDPVKDFTPICAAVEVPIIARRASLRCR